MNTVNAFLSNQALLELIISVIGTIYLIYKKKEVDGRKIEWNSKVALEAIGVGVLQAFQQYVQGMKAQDPNGKVSPEVEAKAHEMATQIASDAAAKKGVDLRSTIGEDFIDYNIKKMLEDLKAKGIIPTKVEAIGASSTTNGGVVQ